MMVGKTVPSISSSRWCRRSYSVLAGRALFHMSWGESPWMLALPVIIATSLAATALGLLIAAVDADRRAGDSLRQFRGADPWPASAAASCREAGSPS